MRDLTEVAGFDAPISVPEGDDDMSLAAESLGAIAQRLANRTRALKVVADDAALLHADSNTFTGRTFFEGADAGLPPIRFDKGPRDDSHSLNKWKNLIEAKLFNTDNVHVYSGDGVDGQAAIVVNAHWNTADQSWHFDDNTKAAYIFYLDATLPARWTCGSKHGGSSWATWDAADIAAGTLWATTVLVGAAVHSASEFDYTAAQTIAYRANMAAPGWPAWRSPTNGHVFFVPDAVDTYAEIAFPLYLPRDATITGVAVQHNQATTAQDRFTLRCRNGVIGAILYEEVAHTDATATIGTRGTVISFSPRVVHAAEDWSVVWKLNGVSDPAAVAGNYVIGIEYTLAVPGPRS